MKKILEEIKILKNSPISKQVKNKMTEFSVIKDKPSKEIFKELCFCLLTANFNAEKSIKIQNSINDKFLTLTEQELKKELKKLGHRFPNARAHYIKEAQEYKENISRILNSKNSEHDMREWLKENIIGLGYKESSHFLRNIGYTDLAIIDFHIIDVLEKNKVISRPKTLTKTVYLEIENKLRQIAQKTNLSLGELDLYLWYKETGKILK